MNLQRYINSKTLIRRFTSLGAAIEFRNTRNTYNNTPVLMGDDQKFWVCNNTRRAYQLIGAGYESAETIE